MAYEIPGQMITLPASTDLSASQYCFVTANGSGQAALTANGAAALGVLQNKPTVGGQAASIMVSGVSKVIAAGSTVAVGDLVAASSVGRAIAAAAGDAVVGRVISGSSGSTGRVLSVLLQAYGSTAALA